MAFRLFAAAAVLSAAFAAHADTLTYRVDVTASGGSQSIVLSYDLQFDPLVNTNDPTTVGATLLSYKNTNTSFDPSFAAPATAWEYYTVPDASLIIGGVQTGVAPSLGLSPGRPNYLLDISFSNGVPSFTSLSEAISGDTQNLTVLTTGTVTITPPLQVVGGSSVTPEPGSFALLGTGLLGVVGVLRRRVA